VTGAPRPVFLKLGGALLTDKDAREAVRWPVLARLAAEVAAWIAGPVPPLVLAHGSGSFAHRAVRETGLDAQPADRHAAARVSAAARRLNVHVVGALLDVGLAPVAVPGMVLATCRGGRVTAVRSDIVAGLLAAGLLPVVYGDVAPDLERGSAVASTEALLAALAAGLAPTRIVLATDVDGVFSADPHGAGAAQPIATLTPADSPDLAAMLGGARPGVVDVTGGMAGKVAAMLDLVARQPDLDVRIVSGLRPGAIAAALNGAATAGGTRLAARP
jgi:isopentenyl phosphate kinase